MIEGGVVDRKRGELNFEEEKLVSGVKGVG